MGRKKTDNGILRMVFTGVALVFQAAWILVRVKLLNEYSDHIAGITAVLTIVVVLKLNSKHTNSAMKMPWIMLIMAFPVMGLCMYLLFELLGDPGMGKRLRRVREYLHRDEEAKVEETLSLHINLPVVEDDCCKAALLKGAFLAGGSVTDPEKGYHMELTTTHHSVAREGYDG